MNEQFGFFRRPNHPKEVQRLVVGVLGRCTKDESIPSDDDFSAAIEKQARPN